MQEYLNPPQAGKQEKVYGEVTFREGDKVMQIKNNYQTEWEKKSKYGVTYDAGSGVFNGDTGIITEINTFMEQMTVKFDDERIVKYDFKQLEELELAYAITVHKSQGSEYPAVVIPMYPGPRMLMNKIFCIQRLQGQENVYVWLEMKTAFIRWHKMSLNRDVIRL